MQVRTGNCRPLPRRLAQIGACHNSALATSKWWWLALEGMDKGGKGVQQGMDHARELGGLAQGSFQQSYPALSKPFATQTQMVVVPGVSVCVGGWVGGMIDGRV